MMEFDLITYNSRLLASFIFLYSFIVLLIDFNKIMSSKLEDSRKENVFAITININKMNIVFLFYSSAVILEC